MDNILFLNILVQEFGKVSLAGTEVGIGSNIFTNSFNKLFDKVTLNTADIFYLIDQSSPYLDAPQVFEWIHLCVFVIPFLLFCFIISLAITSSSLAYKFSNYIIKKKRKKFLWKN